MKLVSVNIEADNHLDKVVPFLKKEKPDIVCLQEVFQADLPRIEEATGLSSVFWPAMNITTDEHPRRGARGLWGIATLSKKMISHHEMAYSDNKEIAPAVTTMRNVWRKGIISGEYEVESTVYKVITTHFTWSPEGQVTEQQRSHMKTLLGILEHEGEFVLCGDFNAARGKDLWEMLASKYKDNIPPNVKTTIDNDLHVTSGKIPGGIQFVVDGMFSTPGYNVSDGRVVSGVSDHCALVGEISRTS